MKKKRRDTYADISTTDYLTFYEASFEIGWFFKGKISIDAFLLHIHINTHRYDLNKMMTKA